MERVKFDGDLWSLKIGDLITHAEEMHYPEEMRCYDSMVVLEPTRDGEWIAVSFHAHGGVAVMTDVEDLIAGDEIALVLKGE